VATIFLMYISVKEAKNQLSELLHRVEAGEEVVLTRYGKPIADIRVHKPKSDGINFEAGKAYLKELGIEKAVAWISPDFDDPLPEDFLITPETMVP
jgi:antitoxin (DNA-binding transcriptional repressor) of toxin-antitoxin stability system